MSNLPIKAGEKVVVLLCEKKYGQYLPAMLPFVAHYNDYGSWEDPVKDEVYTEVEAYMQKRYPGPYIFDGHTLYSVATADLKEFCDGIERGYISPDSGPKYTDPSGKLKIELSMVFVLKEVWDTAIDAMNGKVEDYYHKNSPTLGENIRKELTDFYGRYLKDVEKMRKIIPDYHGELYLRGHDAPTDNNFMKHIVKFLPKADFMENPFFKALLEVQLTNGFMSITRRKYEPNPAAGSQTEEWGLHKALAEKVVEICNNNEKK